MRYRSEYSKRLIQEGFAKGFAEAKAEAKARGEVEGRAAVILDVLEALGIDVPDDARRRITECTDYEQLRLWTQRAITATTVEDLFD